MEDSAFDLQRHIADEFSQEMGNAEKRAKIARPHAFFD